MNAQVEAILDRYVRPVLAQHYGNLEVTRIEAGVVYVKMRGQCSSCALAQYTVEDLVEKELTARLPEVKAAVIDTFDPELYQIAQKFLRHEEMPNGPPDLHTREREDL